MSVVYETKWTQAERDAYLKSHPENFAGPDGSFPIADGNDVKDAWDMAGQGADKAAIQSKVREIAKRLGLSGSLPDTATTESVATVKESVTVRPLKKIATLPICWLEYNARSLNGRIYPKATCDAIFKSAQRKLADSNALPPTTFVSHEAANGNVNTDLIGAPTKVWQEGSKFWANIDLADTSVARNILGLVEGKYLRSGSMRVQGVELMHDPKYDLPLVVCQEGIEPEFLGIDLTTRPGLAEIARIPQVLYESNGTAPYIDEFTFTDVTIESQETPPAMSTIPIYLQVLLHSHPDMQESTPLADAKSAHKRVHDHLAGVLDATVGAKHGAESAAFMALVAEELTEAGRAIAMKHAVPLAKAHDEAAKQSGMACEGAYNPALNIADDPDQDGIPDALDPNDNTQNDQNGESQKGTHAMELTEEQMIAALKAKGFAIETPKTPEQLLQESFDAKLAEQERKFNERLAALTGTADVRRQTLALSNQTEESTLKPEEMYAEGDYLKGELAPKNWRALSDRRVPWPKDIDPKTALAEMAPFLAYRLNMEEANARGRDISTFIESHEQV